MRYVRYESIAVVSDIFYTSDSKIATLGARLIDPNQTSRRRPSDDSEDDDDDDAIFAELEAEIENADNVAIRERGLEAIKREYGSALLDLPGFILMSLQDRRNE